jgi:pectate lyase
LHNKPSGQTPAVLVCLILSEIIKTTMFLKKSFIYALALLALTGLPLHAQQINITGATLFPGVSGFGTDTQGGYRGRIISVTTLSRDGAGSLAEAIRTKGPRIIMFEVAGVIDLAGRSLGIVNPYITIAGGTAPDPGITLVRGGINIGTHDVIIQHLRVRPGEAGHEKKSGWEVDGISTVDSARNVIIDHCSLTWATDENLSASGPQFQGSTPDEWRKNTSHNIVFSNCLIAEGLSNSTHSKGEHSKGTLVHDNVTGILIINNIYASNVERNPLFCGGVKGLIINNFIYNPKEVAIEYELADQEWGDRKWITGEMGVIGNVIEFGPDTKKNLAAAHFVGPVEVFWKDNIINGGPEAREFSGEFTRLDKVPFWPNGLKTMSSNQVRDYVLENAGAFPQQRDEIDSRIVESIRQGTGHIINSEKEVGGYPDNKPVIRKFNENN